MHVRDTEVSWQKAWYIVHAAEPNYFLALMQVQDTQHTTEYAYIAYDGTDCKQLVCQPLHCAE